MPIIGGGTSGLCGTDYRRAKLELKVVIAEKAWKYHSMAVLRAGVNAS
ncbi:MAG: hypothetical protein ACLVCH_13855 [Roseburia inulinivorans]